LNHNETGIYHKAIFNGCKRKYQASVGGVSDADYYNSPRIGRGARRVVVVLRYDETMAFARGWAHLLLKLKTLVKKAR